MKAMYKQFVTVICRLRTYGAMLGIHSIDRYNVILLLVIHFNQSPKGFRYRVRRVPPPGTACGTRVPKILIII